MSPATAFISHAWKYQFLDLENALSYHFRENPDTIIWLDLFTNNQHKAVDLDFTWWETVFLEAIRQFGLTVMILAPWNNPIPLTRGWCIYELYCTIFTGAKFQVAMSGSHTKQFLEDIQRDATGEINKMLATVNAEKSQCFKPEDLVKIHEMIRKLIGFPALNKLVFEALREWVIVRTAVARDEIDENVDPIAKLSLTKALGDLYMLQGKYALSEGLYTTCVNKRKILLGEDHLDTLNSMNNLAGLYKSQGNYSSAEPLYTACLEKRKEVLGEDHPDTLSSLINLGSLYVSQGGKVDKAVNILQQSYDRCLATLGNSHPLTKSAAGWLKNAKSKKN